MKNKKDLWTKILQVVGALVAAIVGALGASAMPL